MKVEQSGESGEVEIKMLSLDDLVQTDWNPNAMPEDKFNMLFDNIAEYGFLEPIVVRSLEGGKYEVVGGNHRTEVARLLGMSEIPAVVKHGMTDDGVKFQNMRLNIIRGDIDPEKFTRLYEELADKYEGEDLAAKFGIVSDQELKRMLISTEKALPDELQESFKKAKDKIKTMDDLVLVLNELFSKQGEQLEKYHYMIVDIEGRDNVWIRTTKKVFKHLEAVCEQCHANQVALDEVLGKMLTALATASADEVSAFFDGLPKATLPETSLPTMDAIEAALAE